MNVSRSKVMATSALLLAVNLSHAEAPSLIQFSAGTPAKAEEVNGNFSGLKSYTAGLESVIEAQAALISALETSTATLEEKTVALESNNATLNQKIDDLQSSAPAPEFDIPVMGDGLVIGFTNHIPSIQHDGKILLKTDFGSIMLEGNRNGGYKLANYDEHNDDTDDVSARFSDAQCSNAIFTISPGDGNPLIFTKIAGTIDNPQLVIGSTEAWVIQAGTVFTTSTATYYYKNGINCDEIISHPEGTVKIPMIELSTMNHNLKHTYTSLSIDGFQLN